MAQKVENLRDVYNPNSIKLASGYEPILARKEALEAAKEVDSNLEETAYNNDRRVGTG